METSPARMIPCEKAMDLLKNRGSQPYYGLLRAGVFELLMLRKTLPMRDTGFWIQDSGFWILDPGFWIRNQ